MAEDRITGICPSQAKTLRLVWGWSENAYSPFSPLYRVDTPAGVQYVDMHGDLTESIVLQ